MTTTLCLLHDVVGCLLAHAGREHPSECCGIMLGTRAGAKTEVQHAVEAKNIATGDHAHRYQVDWQTLFETSRAARDQNREIVGFYHSHTEHRDTPSQLDLDLAWAEYSYVIVTRDAGGCATLTSWRVPRVGDGFERELVVFV